MKFKFLEHTADIKFQAFGKSLEEVFENSGLAVAKVICEKEVKGNKKIKVSVKGKDNESLLYNFLEEILFLFDSENFILSKIEKLKIKDFELTSELFGANSEDYEIHMHVKAVTYNEMFIKKQKDKFITQVVLDV